MKKKVTTIRTELPADEVRRLGFKTDFLKPMHKDILARVVGNLPKVTPEKRDRFIWHILQKAIEDNKLVPILSELIDLSNKSEPDLGLYIRLYLNLNLKLSEFTTAEIINGRKAHEELIKQKEEERLFQEKQLRTPIHEHGFIPWIPDRQGSGGAWPKQVPLLPRPYRLGILGADGKITEISKQHIDNYGLFLLELPPADEDNAYALGISGAEAEDEGFVIDAALAAILKSWGVPEHLFEETAVEMERVARAKAALQPDLRKGGKYNKLKEADVALPVLPDGLKWPSEKYSQSPEYRKRGGLIAYLNRVWRPLIEAGYGERRFADHLDPSVMVAIKAYKRKDKETGEARSIPTELRFLTIGEARRRRMAANPLTILQDPKALNAIARQIRRRDI